MDKVKCENCPIALECYAYGEARVENDFSYHPQNVARVSTNKCPLVSLIRELQEKEAK